MRLNVKHTQKEQFDVVQPNEKINPKITPTTKNLKITKRQTNICMHK